MFMPHPETSMKTIYSYYLATVNVGPEGDAILSDELSLQGLGVLISSFPSISITPTIEIWGLTLNSGYFLAGGLAGTISRTVTAPFDRIKVYLIAKTDTPVAAKAVAEIAKGEAALAAKKVAGPIKECVQALWRAGGVRSFFAGIFYPTL